ncbi:MAG TPA: thioesterase family protein [Gemmatimonadales bacterium]|nr:thioesterase family protein [Gemmatimonadales bacterium]
MPDHLPAASPFELRCGVRPGDIDELGHVSNVVYLRWVQEVASAHWRKLAPPAALAELLWVVVRHEIDYKAPAVLQDEIRLRTWVGTAAGLLFERHTEVRRARDGQLLAQARTLWCPVDSRTHRPRRVSPELRALCSTGDERTA